MINTDQSIQFIYSPDKCEHQCKGVLGASDICTAAHAQHFDAASFARSYINVPKNHPVLVDHFETWRQGQFFSADVQSLGHDRFGRFEIAMEFRLGRYEPDIAGIKVAGGCLDLAAPTSEIRQVRRHKIRKGL